jgi:trans-2,3-dihydro-3-hydroxyanthranilate isomerase
MERRFVTLNVFTKRPLAGNPLAVVLDAEGLSDEAMQAIAREFNLSETVFVLPPAMPQHRARTRIFTPAKELPFAGHPTIGTAFLLASEDMKEGRLRDGIVVLEQGVGPVRVGVSLPKEGPGRAEFDVPRIAEEVGRPASKERLASALGLVPSDIGFDNHKPTVFSAGVPYVFVPVRDREALARALPMRGLWREAFAGDAEAAFVYTRAVEEPEIDVRARMFAPVRGIEEDPATGSAAAAFAGVVTHFDGLADGHHVLHILQGEEMGRPSHMELEIDLEAGSLAGARVGGEAVVVSRGTLSV